MAHIWICGAWQSADCFFAKFTINIGIATSSAISVASSSTREAVFYLSTPNPFDVAIEGYDIDRDSLPRDVLADDTPPQIFFTAKDIAIHNSESDCWVSNNNRVYDLTILLPYTEVHPAVNKLKELCGTDITVVVNSSPVEPGSLNTARVKYALSFLVMGKLALGNNSGSSKVSTNTEEGYKYNDQRISFFVPIGYVNILEDVDLIEFSKNGKKTFSVDFLSKADSLIGYSRTEIEQVTTLNDFLLTKSLWTKDNNSGIIEMGNARLKTNRIADVGLFYSSFSIRVYFGEGFFFQSEEDADLFVKEFIKNLVIKKTQDPVSIGLNKSVVTSNHSKIKATLAGEDVVDVNVPSIWKISLPSSLVDDRVSVDIKWGDGEGDYDLSFLDKKELEVKHSYKKPGTYSTIIYINGHSDNFRYGTVFLNKSIQVKAN